MKLFPALTLVSFLVMVLMVMASLFTITEAQRACGKPCNKDISPACGIRPRDKKFRTFKDQCEMLQYNCDHQDDAHLFSGIRKCEGYSQAVPA